ncbi:hypothetical protein [Thalassotalea piscium]|uniref:Uncharacterized protein n=1 Tax=Thalassotalea piscium TaxID=1230533 RepID=A0A7X0NKK2_9GAMM|nr:hypothetical protein [Thalassotalea piscium]MBB6545120.1 hypothetical protein [Thalassotalea piscium]
MKQLDDKTVKTLLNTKLQCEDLLILMSKNYKQNIAARVSIYVIEQLYRNWTETLSFLHVNQMIFWNAKDETDILSDPKSIPIVIHRVLAKFNNTNMDTYGHH